MSELEKLARKVYQDYLENYDTFKERWLKSFPVQPPLALRGMAKSNESFAEIIIFEAAENIINYDIKYDGLEDEILKNYQEIWSKYLSNL